MPLCATFYIAAGDLAVSWCLQASALLAEPSPQTPTHFTDANKRQVPQQTLMDSSLVTSPVSAITVSLASNLNKGILPREGNPSKAEQEEVQDKQ